MTTEIDDFADELPETGRGLPGEVSALRAQLAAATERAEAAERDLRAAFAATPENVAFVAAFFDRYYGVREPSWVDSCGPALALLRAIAERARPDSGVPCLECLRDASDYWMGRPLPNCPHRRASQPAPETPEGVQKGSEPAVCICPFPRTDSPECEVMCDACHAASLPKRPETPPTSPGERR